MNEEKTLRDEIAMAGMLANPEYATVKADTVVRDAYDLADMMLEGRKA